MGQQQSAEREGASADEVGSLVYKADTAPAEFAPDLMRLASCQDEDGVEKIGEESLREDSATRSTLGALDGEIPVPEEEEGLDPNEIEEKNDVASKASVDVSPVGILKGKDLLAGFSPDDFDELLRRHVDEIHGGYGMVTRLRAWPQIAASILKGPLHEAKLYTASIRIIYEQRIMLKKSDFPVKFQELRRSITTNAATPNPQAVGAAPERIMHTVFEKEGGRQKRRIIAPTKYDNFVTDYKHTQVGSFDGKRDAKSGKERDVTRDWETKRQRKDAVISAEERIKNKKRFWKPEKSHGQGDLAECPTLHPTPEEFEDAISYIDSLRDLGDKYGILKVVPPESWKPPFGVDISPDEFSFKVRWQALHKLLHPKYDDIFQKSKRADGISIDEIDSQQPFSCPGDLMSMDKMLEASKAFELRYFGKSWTRSPLHSSWQWHGCQCSKQCSKFNFHEGECDSKVTGTEAVTPASIAAIEGEFWRIVESPTEEILLMYGADIDASPSVCGGAAFPLPSAGHFNSNLSEDDSDDESVSPYRDAVWSPYVISTCSQSPLNHVLNAGDKAIPGVNRPFIYVGTCMSMFAWHTEDHHLLSANYCHLGAPKVWYGIPTLQADAFEKAVKEELPIALGMQKDILYQLVSLVSPAKLKRRGVDVYRTVQYPGEIILTYPRAYHAGFNTGFNVNEAVNLATESWLPSGMAVLKEYTKNRRTVSFSMDQMLLSIVSRAFLNATNLHNFTEILAASRATEDGEECETPIPLKDLVNLAKSFAIGNDTSWALAAESAKYLNEIALDQRKAHKSSNMKAQQRLLAFSPPGCKQCLDDADCFFLACAIHEKNLCKCGSGVFVYRILAEEIMELGKIVTQVAKVMTE